MDVSPGAISMKTFLDAMDSIQLGENLTRSTARKVVDEQLQTVVKVQSLSTNFNLSALMITCSTGLFTSSVPTDEFGGARWPIPLESQLESHH